MEEKETGNFSNAALVAARWWSDRLADGAGVGDNGACGGLNRELHLPSLISMGMSQKIREGKITAEHVEKFRQLLRAVLLESYMNGNHFYVDGCCGWHSGGPDVTLSVDYHPEPMLYQSLLGAGVPDYVARSSALPLKTNMRVSARRVIVGHGYQAPWVEIYGPGWGCSYEERGRAENARYEAYERSCRKPWEEAIVAKYGPKWNYGMFDDRPPQYDQWQGPVKY